MSERSRSHEGLGLKPRAKYGAQPDCPCHASKREHKRAQELHLLQRAGHIRDLREQEVFELVPAVTLWGRKRPAVRYVADFVYLEPSTQDRNAEWRLVVEDVKGVKTPVFALKAHLMMHVHGLEIRLT
jgi:hypothetical protein